jgi:hypothetical protein
MTTAITCIMQNFKNPPRKAIQKKQPTGFFQLAVKEENR